MHTHPRIAVFVACLLSVAATVVAQPVTPGAVVGSALRAGNTVTFGFFNPVAHFLGMEHPQYKEPWRYGDKALAAFGRYAVLRQRLIPYIYSAAYDGYATGIPMMRPLVLDQPADRRVYDIADEFYFGDAFLVAPVTKAGAAGRSILLPPGDWYDYWTGERHAGDRVIEYAAAPDVLPVFVRGGAIVPMAPAMNYAGEKPVDPLTFDIYPAGRSEYWLYEDDGKGLEYQKGVFARTRVRTDARRTGVTIRVDAPVGPWHVAPRRYVFRVRSDAAPRRVRVDGVVVARLEPATDVPSSAGWWYETNPGRVVVVTGPAGARLSSSVGIDQ